MSESKVNFYTDPIILAPTMYLRWRNTSDGRVLEQLWLDRANVRDGRYISEWRLIPEDGSTDGQRKEK